MLCAAIGAALSGLVFFVLHVTGSGSFPRPLTAAEEKDCLERMQRGDVSGKAELIEHNLRLVAHIIKKYYSNSAEQDDLISIGTIGLIKAVNTFDSSKGIRLSSYAARCIENAPLTLRNPHTPHKDTQAAEFSGLAGFRGRRQKHPPIFRQSCPLRSAGHRQRHFHPSFGADRRPPSEG